MMHSSAAEASNSFGMYPSAEGSSCRGALQGQGRDAQHKIISSTKLPQYPSTPGRAFRHLPLRVLGPQPEAALVVAPEHVSPCLLLVIPDKPLAAQPQPPTPYTRGWRLAQGRVAIGGVFCPVQKGCMGG